MKDAKDKASRTDVESFLLGSYLTKLATESPASVIAYSYGARIASGALHLAAGGQLCGYHLPERLESYNFVQRNTGPRWLTIWLLANHAHT